MLLANRIYQFLGGMAFTCMVTVGKAQVPSNKPTTQNLAPSPTVSVNPTPPAYPSNLKTNFVRTKTAVEPVSDLTTFNNYLFAPNFNTNKVFENTVYFDGLGRPIQTVVKGGIMAGSYHDQVVPVLYDSFGRQKYIYEPYADTGSWGQFRLNPFTAQSTFFSNHFLQEQVFYTQTEYEASPLNRVLKVMPPGNSWAGSGRGTSYQYLINTAADSVRIWNIENNPLTYTNSDDSVNIPTSMSEYAAGELYKNVTIDEDSNAVVEYKDKEGRIILKKIQIGTLVSSNFSGYEGWLCTYYIYDDFGQLRFIISPKAVASIKGNWVISSEIVKELCFRYEYDERSRMVAKKVPGAGWSHMVYDRRDRLIFSQTANLRLSNQWLTTLYDEMNRQVLTGMITYNGDPDELQDFLNQQPEGTFTLQAAMPQPGSLYVSERNPELDIYTASESISFTEFESEAEAEFTAEITSEAPPTEAVEVTGPTLPPLSNFIPLTITYYDNYDWKESGNFQFSNVDNAKLNNVNSLRYLDNVPDTNSLSTTGMVTGTKIRVLENPADLNKGNWLTTVNYFDEKGRIIQTQSDNYKGGLDIVTNRYDFNGVLHVNYAVHTNPAAGNTRARIRTKSEYYLNGQLAGIRKQLNDQGEDKILVSNFYNNLGKVKSALKFPIITLFAYNIRGWLTDVSTYDFVLNPLGSIEPYLWFRQQLNYNYGFEKNQYNGNIAGMRWKSRGDGEMRAFGFSYDRANRIMSADFTQYDGSSYVDNSTFNFDILMGNGTDATTAYDENGNILAMKQWGLKVNSSSVIDDLSYGYYPNSNQLQNVIDNQNDVQTKLADFRSSQQYMNHLVTKTNEAMDYHYDKNGNMVMDLNKDIFLQNGEGTYENPSNGILYNHLNLPWKVNVHGKGNILYIYDAVGTKLEKRVQDFAKTDPNTTTYISGFQYENDSLQFFGHEEGRVRYAKKYFLNGDSAKLFFYDYFLKDHLGNVRMVLTEQRDTARYVATMETAYRAKEEKLFYNIPETEYPVSAVSGGYPVDTTVTNPNQFVSRLNGNGPKVGPSLVLKVMSGDAIDIAVRSYYRAQANPGENHDPLQDIINVLASGIVGAAGESKGSQSNLSNISSSPLLPALNSFRNAQNPDPLGKPKAYLNWILLDEQFRYVNSYPQSGAMPVGNADQLTSLGYNGINITRNGYLYIYVSNETQNWDVFFDNLIVQHRSGPLLEETHYYPFGLAMAGISSKALKPNYSENKHKFNDGSELENKEFSDGSGLEWYATEFRKYDPQIGRFHQMDAMSFLSVDYSPYAFANNNPVLLNDPLGLFADTTKTNPFDNAKILDEVVVTPANNEQLDTENGQVYEPRSRFWDFLNGQRVFPTHFKIGDRTYTNNMAVDHRGYLTGKTAPNTLTFTAPIGFNRLNVKAVFNLKNWIKGRFAVYRGMKGSKLYIGKATTEDGSLVLRYSADEIAELEARVIAGLDNIPNNAVALGIEQIIIDLNGGIGAANIANKIPATVKQIYMTEARYYLDANLPGWETLLKFQ